MQNSKIAYNNPYKFPMSLFVCHSLKFNALIQLQSGLQDRVSEYYNVE